MNEHSHGTDDDLTELWEEVAAAEGADRAHALCHLGQHFFSSGDIDEALAAADAAKELFLEAGEVDEAAHCDHNAAVALRALGRDDESLVRHEEAIAGHMAGDWAHAAALCRLHVAALHEHAGRIEEARIQLRAADKEFERLAEVGLRGEALLGRARIAFKRGRFTAAAEAAARALPMLEEAAPVTMVADGHCAMAKSLTVLGRYDEARAAWRRARAIYDALDDEGSVADCDLELAEILVLTEGADRAAVSVLADLRAQFKSEGDVIEVARVDLLRGRLLLDLDPQTAAQLFEDAEAVARACANVEVAAEADMRAGCVLVRTGDVAGGVRRIRRGRRQLERLHRADLVIEARVFLMRTFVAEGDEAAAKRQAVVLHELLEHSGMRNLLGEVAGVRGIPRRPVPAA